MPHNIIDVSSNLVFCPFFSASSNVYNNISSIALQLRAIESNEDCATFLFYGSRDLGMLIFPDRFNASICLLLHLQKYLCLTILISSLSVDLQKKFYMFVFFGLLFQYINIFCFYKESQYGLDHLSPFRIGNLRRTVINYSIYFINYAYQFLDNLNIFHITYALLLLWHII